MKKSVENSENKDYFLSCNNGVCGCNLKFLEVKQVNTTDDLKAKLERARKNLVVLFFSKATECDDCEKVEPGVEQVAVKYQNKGVLFLKIDVDRLVDVKTEYKINAKKLPTFVFVQNDKEVPNTRVKELNLVEKNINEIKRQKV